MKMQSGPPGIRALRIIRDFSERSDGMSDPPTLRSYGAAGIEGSEAYCRSCEGRSE